VLTSERFKYNPEEEEESPLDASFYCVIKVKKGAKGTHEIFDNFIFSDFRLFDKLAYGLLLYECPSVVIDCYTFHGIEELKKNTTGEERKAINNEYDLLERMHTQYKSEINRRDFVVIDKDRRRNQFKKEMLTALSKKKAVELTAIDKLYIQILLK